MTQVIHCYTDGACRGNGSSKPIGSIGICIIKTLCEIIRKGDLIHDLSLQLKTETIEEYSEYLGNTVNIENKEVKVTNNITEYLAFIKGLEMLLEIDTDAVEEVIVKVDSKLVSEQINERWKVKNPILKMLHKRAKELLESSDKDIKVFHIYRDENKRADELANEAIESEQLLSEKSS